MPISHIWLPFPLTFTFIFELLLQILQTEVTDMNTENEGLKVKTDAILSENRDLKLDLTDLKVKMVSEIEWSVYAI